MTSMASQGRRISVKAFATIVVAISTCLLCSGLFGFWYLLTPNPLRLNLGVSSSEPTAAVFVPRQAVAMISTLAAPEQFSALAQFLPSPIQRNQVQADWQRLQSRVLSPLGLSYETDVRPWLGSEITFSMTDLDLDQDSRNGFQPGYLLAIETQNADRARECLELFWQRQALAGNDLNFEVTNGVRIIHAQPTPLISPDAAFPGQTLATALVGNRFLLLANHPQVLHHSIRDAQAPDLNIQARSDYQQSLNRLDSQSLGFAYVNVPQMIHSLGLAQPRSRSIISTSDRHPSTSPQLQALMVGMGLNRQGLRLNTVLSATAQYPFEARTPQFTQPVSVLQQLPPETVFSASGHNLTSLWGDLSGILSHYEEVSLPLTHWQPLLTLATDTPLLTKLQTWLTGPYAVGCLSTGDWVFVAEQTLRSGLAIEAIDQIARDQDLTVSPLTLNHQGVTAWTRIKTYGSGQSGNRETTVETEILGVHATVNQRELFATSLAAMTAALNAPQNSLMATSTFDRAIAPLSRPNEGQLYIDWSGLKSVLHPVPLFNVLETTLHPVLKYLDTIAIGSYGGDTTQRQGDIWIQLSKS